MSKGEKEILRTEIEEVREQLNQAMEEPKDMEYCYMLSVKLDGLIEKYIEFCEKNVVQV